MPSARLAGARSFLGAFDAVIDGVAQQMAERRVELLENVAIDLRAFADDLEPHPLAEIARDVADHAREGADAIGEWPHADHQRLIVEAVREARGLVIGCLELVELLRQKLPAGDEAAAGPRQRGAGAFSSRCRGKAACSVSSAPAVSRCIRFSRSSDWRERPEPARLDERFAGQIEQAVEIVRADAQRAVGRLGREVFAVAGGGGAGDGVGRGKGGGGGVAGGCIGSPAGPCAFSAATKRSASACHSRAGAPLSRFGALAIMPSRSTPRRSRSIWAVVEHRLAALRGDEEILHRMRDHDRRPDFDDARRALQRMGGAHAGFELFGAAGILLERQQAERQRLRLAFRFDAEQVVHRKLAEILASCQAPVRARRTPAARRGARRFCRARAAVPG